MSGISGAIDAALSGLQLFEAGINTVSENLANQATPGYGAETASATTAAGSPGEAGLGVAAPIITRAANGFAAGLLRAATSTSQAAAAQSSSLTAISNALQNNGDTQAAITQFFNDVGTLAANPTSGGQRQTVLSDLQTVTNTFKDAAGAIATTQTEAAVSLGQNVTLANNLLTQLASINTSLTSSPNDPNLLDQQQAALNSLAGLIPVNVLPQANGQAIITTGGTVMLDQSGAQSLTLTPGAGTTPPVLTAGATNVPVNVTAFDGEIGANIASVQAGGSALQGLNARAAVFASALNTAQAQGLNTIGAQGVALVSVPAPSATAASTNTGTATLSAQISDTSQLPTDGGPFLLSYNSSSGWSALDQSSGQTYAVGPGTTLAFAGLTVSVGGAALSGDKFVVNPAPEAATGITVATADPNAIAAADPYVATPGVLQSDGSVVNGNAGVILSGADSVAAIPVSGATVVPSSYFGQSLQLTFTSSSSYSIATAAAPTVSIASGSLTNGNGTIAVGYPSGAAGGQYWQLPISGTPAAGDSLALTPGGSSSGSNASRIAALWTTSAATTDGSLQQSFVGFTTTLGANAQQAQQVAANATVQVNTATTNLQTIGGVSPDQQAVILTSYQQAYQAAAQVISTAHSMFESLLQAL
jgi:flagellar hook-associated protein 1 FlgK